MQIKLFCLLYLFNQISTGRDLLGWTILLEQSFAKEYEEWPGGLKQQFGEAAGRLSKDGPQLGRPLVDHLKGSRHSNMKELRFGAEGGCWRLAFAFNPRREAVMLAAGDKAGPNQKRFYKSLIRTADERFDEHLDDCKNNRKLRCVLLFKM